MHITMLAEGWRHKTRNNYIFTRKCLFRITDMSMSLYYFLLRSQTHSPHMDICCRVLFLLVFFLILGCFQFRHQCPDYRTNGRTFFALYLTLALQFSLGEQIPMKFRVDGNAHSTPVLPMFSCHRLLSWTIASQGGRWTDFCTVQVVCSWKQRLLVAGMASISIHTWWKNHAIL